MPFCVIDAEENNGGQGLLTQEAALPGVSGQAESKRGSRGGSTCRGKGRAEEDRVWGSKGQAHSWQGAVHEDTPN